MGYLLVRYNYATFTFIYTCFKTEKLISSFTEAQLSQVCFLLTDIAVMWVLLVTIYSCWRVYEDTLFSSLLVPFTCRLLVLLYFLMVYAAAAAATAAAAKSLQLCPTLCDPIDGSPKVSSIPGILQARILEWVAISFSNACMQGNLLQLCPTLCDPIDSSPLGSSVHRIL